jgi:SAM-dependent methyltransferase
MLEGIEAQRPGREVGSAEYVHICHRYWVAGRIAEGRRTVELACGPGLGTAHLRRVAALYVAGDLSFEHLALARRASPGTLLLRMRAESLPITSERCQVILALEVAQYLDIAAFLGEVRRVLAPDGVLFLTLPNCRREAFVPSTLAREYLDGAGWRERCEAVGLHAHIFGAFREPGWLARTRRAVGIVALRGAAHALNLVDPGHRFSRLRRGARQVVGYKPLQLPNVLSQGDLSRASVEPLELLQGARRRFGGHTFLYIVAARDAAVADGLRERLVGGRP